MTPGRWPPDRHPAAVPDEPGEVAPELDGDPRSGLEVHGGVDTDVDGHPDTLLTDDGVDLLVLTDLDGDGLADRVLRIGPDGMVQHGEVHPGHAHPVDVRDAFHPDAGPGDPSDGDDRRPGAGAGSFWRRLLDDLFGPGG